MGTIKDIIDITTKLSSKVNDRKLATEILQIQTLILLVQRTDAELVTENLNLKKKIFEFEKEISQLKQQSSQKVKLAIAEANEKAKKRAKSYGV